MCYLMNKKTSKQFKVKLASVMFTALSAFGGSMPVFAQGNLEQPVLSASDNNDNDNNVDFAQLYRGGDQKHCRMVYSLLQMDWGEYDALSCEMGLKTVVNAMRCLDEQNFGWYCLNGILGGFLSLHPAQSSLVRILSIIAPDQLEEIRMCLNNRDILNFGNDIIRHKLERLRCAWRSVVEEINGIYNNACCIEGVDDRIYDLCMIFENCGVIYPRELIPYDRNHNIPAPAPTPEAIEGVDSSHM